MAIQHASANNPHPAVIRVRKDLNKVKSELSLSEAVDFPLSSLKNVPDECLVPKTFQLCKKQNSVFCYLCISSESTTDSQKL
jgi:hypothetical protein